MGSPQKGSLFIV